MLVRSAAGEQGDHTNAGCHLSNRAVKSIALRAVHLQFLADESKHVSARLQGFQANQQQGKVKYVVHNVACHLSFELVQICRVSLAYLMEIIICYSLYSVVRGSAC